MKIILISVLCFANVGCAVAEDTEHKVDDMLPSYVCTTKEHINGVIKESFQAGYASGVYEAKHKMVKVMVDKIKDECENVGSGNELRISEDVILICK